MSYMLISVISDTFAYRDIILVLMALQKLLDEINRLD